MLQTTTSSTVATRYLGGISARKTEHGSDKKNRAPSTWVKMLTVRGCQEKHGPRSQDAPTRFVVTIGPAAETSGPRCCLLPEAQVSVVSAPWVYSRYRRKPLPVPSLYVVATVPGAPLDRLSHGPPRLHAGNNPTHCRQGAGSMPVSLFAFQEPRVGRGTPRGEEALLWALYSQMASHSNKVA